MASLVLDEPKKDPRLVLDEPADPRFGSGLFPEFPDLPDYEFSEEHRERMQNSLYYSVQYGIPPEMAWDMEPELNQVSFGKKKLSDNPGTLFFQAFSQSLAEKPAMMLRGAEVYTPGQAFGLDPLLDKASVLLESLKDPDIEKRLQRVASGKLWPIGEDKRWWQIEPKYLPEVINSWAVNVGNQIPILLTTFAGRAAGKVLGKPIGALAGAAAALVTGGPDPSDVATAPAVVGITQEVVKHLAGAAPLIAMEAGAFMDDANALNIDPDISEKYAKLYGLGSGAIEYSQQLWVLGRYSKIAKTGQTTIMKQVLSHLGGSAFEGVEEISQGGLENFLLQKAVAEMKERHPDYEGKAPDITEGWQRNGAIGAGVSLLTGLPGTGMSIADGQIARQRLAKPETKKLLGEPSVQEIAKAKEAIEKPAEVVPTEKPTQVPTEKVVTPKKAKVEVPSKALKPPTREPEVAEEPVVKPTKAEAEAIKPEQALAIYRKNMPNATEKEVVQAILDDDLPLTDEMLEKYKELPAAQEQIEQRKIDKIITPPVPAEEVGEVVEQIRRQREREVAAGKVARGQETEVFVRGQEQYNVTAGYNLISEEAVHIETFDVKVVAQLRSAFIHKDEATIQKADIRNPILLGTLKGESFVIDGHHRVEKAIQEGKSIQGFVLTEKQTKQISSKIGEDIVPTPQAKPPAKKVAKPVEKKAREVEEPGTKPLPVEKDIVSDKELPSVTSARNAAIAEDRESMGLDEVASVTRKSWKTSLKNAEKKKLADNALRTAAEVNDTPRALNDEETAGIVIKAARLKNEHKGLMEKIKQVPGNDIAIIKSLSAEMEQVETEFEMLSDALKLSGTEMGRALASRKLTINQSYDLVSVAVRAKAAKGEALSAQERQRLAELTTKLEGAMAKIEALQKQVDESTAQNAIKSRGVKRYSRMSLEQKDTELNSLVSEINELVEKGCY